MKLPELTNWDGTRKALHQALAAIQVVRTLDAGELPNYLQHSVFPAAYGATTGLLSFGGELRMNFRATQAEYVVDGSTTFTVPMAGHTQASFVKAVLDKLAEAGHELEPDLEHAIGTDSFDFDAEMAASYADVMWRMYTALAQVRGRFFGGQSPIALWTHGFDLSTVWFAQGLDEHADPHVNYGFSPGTPDVGQPYVYFYAYPKPDGIEDKLPSLIDWHTEWGTPGGILKYEKFVGHDDPEGVIVDTLWQVYRVTRDLMTTA